MRALSERAARNCEQAAKPTCRCRCGGALHGAKRAGKDNPPRDWFESLPEDDPHHLPPKPQVPKRKPKPKQVKLPGF